ncbi:MAG: bifunctional 4-hydroxy-2-oxoglutarate aldolase/2-dehydro-3-deoxy-phosphogluconate aldolase [Spirochaetales bacterium]|nr:bifunctional 4-hydroxy-2-oxoglutarate aldolase/2-dehydro-3-deoxy-phosphogluconate aldolase [Spirochaetales bacterium]
MNDLYPFIQKIGLVPVIKLDNPKGALALGQALIDGDLPIAEVTFRAESAAASIEILAKKMPNLLVGAGTVITLDQAKRARDAGAKFLVSPGFDEEIVDFALSHGLPMFPGVNNPTQVQQGIKKGFTVLKFFPAEASGGTAMLDALAGPFPQISFVPTGGIGPANLAEYARRKNVLAIGGSWMVPAKAITEGNWAEIARLCKEARQLKSSLS